MNDTLKNNNETQSGRSMVEVLGVLAIVGVLSVGAVIGYSYGMDKYRANQTINNISLRGVDIITKTTNINHINPDALEDELTQMWANEETIYPTSFYHDEEHARFGIQITGVPSRVCKFIGDGITNHIEMWVGTEEVEDQDTDLCDRTDINTIFFFFTPAQCVPACHPNEECIDGECHGTQCETPDDCNQGYTGTACSICSLGRCQIAMNTEGAECTFTDGTAGQCNQGTCIEKPEEGCTYDTNVCTGGLYCASPNTSLDEAFPEGETGTCVEPRFSKYTINVNGTTEIWHISDNTLSYWDTAAACEAKNWTLPSMTDFVNSWNGSEGGFTRTQRAENLDNAANGSWGWPTVWTTGKGTDRDGKTVHYWVDLTTNYDNVGYAGRNQGTYYNAACKEAGDPPCVGDECQCTYDTNICTGGYYCASPNTSLTTAFQDGETGACVEPQFNKYTINVNGTTEIWYISTTPLSYWDATAACAAKNLTILSASDWVNNWNGQGTFDRNERAQKLTGAIGAYTQTPKIWSTSSTTNGQGQPVFYWVNITDNITDRWNVSWAGRNHSQTYFAACKE